MKKLSSYNNIFWFLLFIILYSANGISFLNRNSNSFSIIIILVVSLYWMYRNKLKSARFFRLLIPWIIYCLVSFVYFEKIHPIFFIILPIYFFSAYVLLKSKISIKIIFNSYEKIIFTLGKISLFFFIWQIIDISSLVYAFSFIDLNIGDSYNAIVYTIHHRFISGDVLRNCGFCWEPGPFACFLVLALIIYLLKNKFIFDKRVVLYIITILSTNSSTGYYCLAIIIMWYFYIKSKKYFVVIMPIVLLFSLLIISNSDDFTQKVLPQFYSAQDNIEFYTSEGSEEMVSIGRFDGFLLNLIDFKNHPIIGFGGHFKATISQIDNLNVSSTSGLGNWLAQYGIIGFLFLVFCFYKSSILVTGLYGNTYAFFLFSIYLVIGFSFNLIDSPLFMCFFFLNIFVDKKALKNHE